MADEQQQINHLKTQLAKMESLLENISKQETIYFFNIEHMTVDGPFTDKLDFMFDKIDVKEVSGALNLGNNFGVKGGNKKQKKKQNQPANVSSSQHPSHSQSTKSSDSKPNYSVQSESDSSQKHDDIGHLSSLTDFFHNDHSSSNKRLDSESLSDPRSNSSTVTINKNITDHSNTTSKQPEANLNLDHHLSNKTEIKSDPYQPQHTTKNNQSSNKKQSIIPKQVDKIDVTEPPTNKRINKSNQKETLDIAKYDSNLPKPNQDIINEKDVPSISDDKQKIHANQLTSENKQTNNASISSKEKEKHTIHSNINKKRIITNQPPPKTAIRKRDLLSNENHSIGEPPIDNSSKTASYNQGKGAPAPENYELKTTNTITHKIEHVEQHSARPKDLNKKRISTNDEGYNDTRVDQNQQLPKTKIKQLLEKMRLSNKTTHYKEPDKYINNLDASETASDGKVKDMVQKPDNVKYSNHITRDQGQQQRTSIQTNQQENLTKLSETKSGFSIKLKE